MLKKNKLIKDNLHPDRTYRTRNAYKNREKKNYIEAVLNNENKLVLMQQGRVVVEVPVVNAIEAEAKYIEIVAKFSKNNASLLDIVKNVNSNLTTGQNV